MTQVMINDLKDFITASLNQRFAEFRVELRSEMRADINQAFNELRTEMHEGFQRLDNKIDQVHNQLNKKIDNVHQELDAKIDSLASTVFEAIDLHHDDHEKRIIKLEKKLA